MYKIHLKRIGKSTITGCLIAHALTFFPGIRAVIVNMDQGAGTENINKIRFVLENLPPWMKFIPKKSNQHVTKIQLQNDSLVQVVYPSTIKSPDQLARSLTIPILYIDEVAFINHIAQIFGAAQPTLSTAREQAERHGYPYWILMTTTPNGSEGRGKFFFDYWKNAVDSDDLFEVLPGYEDVQNQNLVYEKFVDNCDEIAYNDIKNSFIRVRFHWSEDPRKTDIWYREQCKELNFDKRRIGQEIDLQFVGSQHCIFDDDILEKLQTSTRKPDIVYNSKHGSKLKIFKDIDPLDYYIIGVDTASSYEGCYSAIEIFSFKNFEQVAEMAIKTDSLKMYAQIVEDVSRKFIAETQGRVILAIENNSIGKAIIEHFTMNPDDPEFNYFPYLYYEQTKLDGRGRVTEYGISTNARTKPLMTSMFFDYVNEAPELFYSEELVTQLHTIERNHAGQIASKSYSDMFMACCFTAYVRKMKELEIMPLLTYGNEQLADQKVDDFKTIAQLSSPKEFVKNQIAREESFLFYNEEMLDQRQTDDSDLPFFFG